MGAMLTYFTLPEMRSPLVVQEWKKGNVITLPFLIDAKN
jgi:hypothetical protein